MTVDRFSPICSISNCWVATSEKYIDIVKMQLPEIRVNNLLAVPEARNTASCIVYACWKISKHFPDANIVVTPSDALVINTTEFQRVISEALKFTVESNAIITVSIKPSCPEIAYGYIAAFDVKATDEII